MSYWPRGNVRVDPDNPEAVAYCDRCGAPYNHSDLQFQYEWAGTMLSNTQLLVCDDCLNEPDIFLKTRKYGPDPVPIMNPRPFNRDNAMTDYRITENGTVRSTEDDRARVID